MSDPIISKLEARAQAHQARMISALLKAEDQAVAPHWLKEAQAEQAAYYATRYAIHLLQQAQQAQAQAN